jgi:hypothetical protein
MAFESAAVQIVGLKYAFEASIEQRRWHGFQAAAEIHPREVRIRKGEMMTSINRRSKARHES